MRSFASVVRNDEAELHVYDAALPAGQTGVFEVDPARSYRVNLQELQNRSSHEKAMERPTSLLNFSCRQLPLHVLAQWVIGPTPARALSLPLSH